MRAPRTAGLAAVLLPLLAWLPTAHAGAPVGTLTPDTSVARPGDIVQLSGDFCNDTLTVTDILVTVAHGSPSGPADSATLDPVAAGLVQDPTGFTFQYTVTTEETYVSFVVTCSDGGVVGSPSVAVWPLLGQFWFRSPADGASFPQGATVSVDAASLDCVDGSTASAELLADGTPVAAATTTIAAGVMQFEILVPADAAAGPAELFVTCDANAGGEIVDGRVLTIVASAPTPTPTPPTTVAPATAPRIPTTGGTPPVVPAALLLGAGLVLSRAGRRRAAA